MANPRRLLIVSNRLPFTVRCDRGAVDLVPAAGGLATGLRQVHEQTDSVWVGWPGDVSDVPAAHLGELSSRFAEKRIVPVPLTRDESQQYYDEFCNGVLWPLLHYLIDRIPYGPSQWEAYRRINLRFADAIVQHYRPGDLVWVHDYHLLLVPGLLRQRLPDASIGFFLHVPFPAPDIFRVLPWRREILEGLLGAGLIGFHTPDYAAHFTACVRSLTGIDLDASIGGHPVRVRAYPMGIDARRFAALAEDPAVVRESEMLRDRPGQRLLLGIDRLDYTKGIPRRLLAYERLLLDHPELRGRVRLIQVAVPSRSDVPSYQHYRQQVEELVGRINGRLATVDWTPIRYLHQSVSPSQLVALYRAADVMLVTPLRDGMNLVAKEFVASRTDGDGVLVLSEFAGVASEFQEAVLVNPYDIEALARAVTLALTMPEAERRHRIAALQQQVVARDVAWWAETIRRDLEAPEMPREERLAPSSLYRTTRARRLPGGPLLPHDRPAPAGRAARSQDRGY
jgi:trehalose 6-phosphate synthase/phosphatase